MADVEALKRVLTRLGLTEDDKLQGILEKLLPLVLGKLDNAPPPVQQQQVLAILSHVNTRLQSSPTIEKERRVEEGDVLLNSCCHLSQTIPYIFVQQAKYYQDVPWRLKIEQELQTDGLSEAERRAVVDDYERRELDYTRLQRQRLCMATLEAVKEAART